MVFSIQRSKRTSGKAKLKYQMNSFLSDNFSDNHNNNNSNKINAIILSNNYNKFNYNGHRNQTNSSSSWLLSPFISSTTTIKLWPLIILILQGTLTTVDALPSTGIHNYIGDNKIHDNQNEITIPSSIGIPELPVVTKIRHIANSSKLDSHHRRFRSTPLLTSLSQTSSWNSARNINNIEPDNFVTKNITEPRLHGYRIEDSDKDAEIGPIPTIMSYTKTIIRVFGEGITNDTMIVFTEEEKEFGEKCEYRTSSGPFRVDSNSIADGGTTALFTIELQTNEKKNYYFCAKYGNQSLKHQGSNEWLQIKSSQPLLPIWASIIIIVTCLAFSALFSGLNLGLMALDRTELKILCNTGTEKEKLYASKIQPVRDHGNYLLCSILLGNVLVNSTFTILLDSLTSGLIAVIFSTLAIVLFGEITPQAICSRHGLAVGAKTIYVTKAIMIITAPLSYPVSKVLDYLLGEEIGNVYNRERLKELVRVTTGINDLDKDEVNIISGALELRKKTVAEVMTHIEDAFMLSLDSILDFETVSEIMKSGFSRIPVYDGDRKNIVTLLYIKDLAFVDPDDNTPLKTLCEFYQNPCHFIFEDTTLDIMFKQFKSGQIGHMAFVHRINSEGEGDPFYETIGLLTLEDVIEELIQAEIVDETDVFLDNRTKIRRTKVKKQDFTIFAERRDNQRIRISPQLTLATFQYLSTTIDAFKPDNISETILRRLLNQEVIHHIKCKGKEKDDPSIYIYQQGKPVDFFVLILEGRVEVTVGKENLVFESGPFTFFGTQALVPNVGVDSPNQAQPMGSLQSLNMDALLKHTFVPDYSVRAVTDVIYISIKRTLYLAAKRATLLERSKKVPGSDLEAIDDEVEKLLHSLDEDDVRVQYQHSNAPKSLQYQNTNKTGSNTPSPTFKSVSRDALFKSKKYKDGSRYKKNEPNNKSTSFIPKEIVPNGPTPISPNSNATSVNQQASLMSSSQASNSLNQTTPPNLTSPTSQNNVGNVIGNGGGDGIGNVNGGAGGEGFVQTTTDLPSTAVYYSSNPKPIANIDSMPTTTATTISDNDGQALTTDNNSADHSDHVETPLLSQSKS